VNLSEIETGLDVRYGNETTPDKMLFQRTYLVYEELLNK